MTEEKGKIDFKYNLKVYWSFLKKYRLPLALLIFAAFLIEVFTVLDSFLFKIIIDKGELFLDGSITKAAFVSILLFIASVYAGFVVFKSVSKWFHTHLTNIIDASLMYDLKQRYFNHILFLSHRFHTTHKTGSLIARLSRGSSAMERMTDFFAFNTLPLIFQLVLVTAALWYFNFATAIVVVISSFVFIAYGLFILNLQRPANIASNRAEDIEKGNLADFFTNIDSIKHFGKEEYISGRFTSLTQNSKKALLKYWSYGNWFNGGLTFILAVSTFFLVYFPIKGFLNGTLSLSTLVFVYTIYGNLFGSLFGFVYSVRGYYRSMADFNDLFSYGLFENEIKDKPNAPPLVVKAGSIEFRNVAFKYQDQLLFKNFNLVVPAGKKVALVGHSGSGKSTLVKLLYRLYDVNAGEILIDGTNVNAFKQESLRSELSIVPQECVLFDDTIYNNVAFSRPDATRKEVMAAMKFAQLDRVIENFPKKENTVVGERGVRLSGGEKQRVSVARAILANKRILVLDEATSSLDSQTEHDIQRDLKRLMEGRTSVIIAHRLSTIMHADLIVVLDKGKIVQLGTHQQLIKKKGMYRTLWDLQKDAILAGRGRRYGYLVDAYKV